MAKLYPLPNDLTPPIFDPQLDMSDVEAFSLKEQEFIQTMQDRCRRGNPHGNIGKVFNAEAPGGYAMYVVAGHDSLIHLPVGDNYALPDEHIKGLSRYDINYYVDREAYRNSKKLDQETYALPGETTEDTINRQRKVMVTLFVNHDVIEMTKEQAGMDDIKALLNRSMIEQYAEDGAHVYYNMTEQSITSVNVFKSLGIDIGMPTNVAPADPNSPSEIRIRHQKIKRILIDTLTDSPPNQSTGILGISLEDEVKEQLGLTLTSKQTEHYVQSNLNNITLPDNPVLAPVAPPMERGGQENATLENIPSPNKPR